jgi:hypothetical protein
MYFIAKAREYMQAFQFKNSSGPTRGNSITDIKSVYQNMNSLSLKNSGSVGRANSVGDLKTMYQPNKSD